MDMNSTGLGGATLLCLRPGLARRLGRDGGENRFPTGQGRYGGDILTRAR